MGGSDLLVASGGQHVGWDIAQAVVLTAGLMPVARSGSIRHPPERAALSRSLSTTFAV